MSEPNTVTIQTPRVLPLGQEVDRGGVQMVWDTYIKPNQKAGNIQSIEERYLMAILSSVYNGLPETFIQESVDG